MFKNMQRDTAQEEARCALLTQPVLCFWRCVQYITVSHGFAIQNCTVLPLPLHLLCSLPTSLALALQLCPAPCSCPADPAVPFFQLCQNPLLSIATILCNYKFLIFAKVIHCSGHASCAIFHKKYPADTEQKLPMLNICLEAETQ